MQQIHPVARVAAGLVGAAAGLVLVGRLLPTAGHRDPALEWLARHRRPLSDRATAVICTLSDTAPTVTLVVAAYPVLRRVGLPPRAAAAPAVAATLETAVFVVAATLVGRPRPDVPRLDRPAPTASFPSGHTAASTAVSHTLSAALEVIEPRLRGAASIARVVVPLAVGFSRLYRGMHHPSDVLAGALLGTWVAVLVRRLTGLP